MDKLAPIGYFQATAPVDASYHRTLQLTIVYPHNREGLRSKLMSGIIFVLAACGIQNSGHIAPADAFKRTPKGNN